MTLTTLYSAPYLEQITTLLCSTLSLSLYSITTNQGTTMLTRQEMFNRAFVGLRSQGFTQSLEAGSDTQCAYSSQALDGTVKHCAWGWVDPTISYIHEGKNVSRLVAAGIGLAAAVLPSDVNFVERLQCCHDNQLAPTEMEAALRRLAAEFGLAIPE